MKYLFCAGFLLLLLACNSRSHKENQDSLKLNEEIHTQEKLIEEYNAESIYDIANDKVVLVLALKDGIPLSQGSGFYISEDSILTNYHVIQGSSSINIKFSDTEDIIKGVKIAKASQEHDLAILVSQNKHSFLPIDSLENEKIGSKIFTIGNPRGLEGTISEGILSGKRISDNIEYLQITAPISPGNSGGPILNTKGDVIGVSTFTFKGSQNLNFGIPIKYISECIDYLDIPTDNKPILKKNEPGALQLTNFQKIGSEFDEYISLKNNTEDVITSCEIVIIYKSKGEIIDYQTLNFTKSIEPGLAKRFSYRSFDQDQDWEYIKERNNFHGHYKPFDIELRILSYTIEE